MPPLRTISGITETYPTDLHRFQPVGSAEGSAEHRHRGQPDDRSNRSAQAAYQQQAGRSHSSKPALVAHDLMTAPVTTLSSDRTAAEAWTAMRTGTFRHLPITSLHGALVGMVSDRDLLKHVPELIVAGNVTHAQHRRLADVMSARVISATPTTDIRDIARVMLEERIHALPIVDAQRRPIGIISRRDLLRGLAHHAPLELWT